MSLELNQTVDMVWTCTSGTVPRSVVNTILYLSQNWRQERQRWEVIWTALEKLGQMRIWCYRHVTISDMEDTTSKPAGDITNTQLSKPNQSSNTFHFSYSLLSSILYHLHSLSLFLVHIPTIMEAYKFQSSLSISLYIDHQLTLITSYTEYSIHWVQYTPCTVYTKNSIHQVQNTLSPVYTKYRIHEVQLKPSTVYTE
jgi:hypothetical protein